jgi:RNA-binding protein
MSKQKRRRAHDLDVTVWIGKGGIEAVVDELADQLEERGMVKVKFLRSARGGTDTETLAADLAERTGANLYRTRGHTGVYTR